MQEWEKLPKYKCAKLVASYPRRLKAVIAAKGALNQMKSNVFVTYTWLADVNASVAKCLCF